MECIWLSFFSWIWKTMSWTTVDVPQKSRRLQFQSWSHTLCDKFLLHERLQLSSNLPERFSNFDDSLGNFKYAPNGYFRVVFSHIEYTLWNNPSGSSVAPVLSCRTAQQQRISPLRRVAMPFSEKGEKAIVDLFNLVDTNKNGKLEKTEQKKAKKNIHSMMLPKARWSWKDMDKNRDGKISKSEWHE